MVASPDYWDQHWDTIDHVSNKDLYAEVPKATDTVKLKILKEAGHCYRLPDEAVSDLALRTPNHGKWGRERQPRPMWVGRQGSYTRTFVSNSENNPRRSMCVNLVTQAIQLPLELELFVPSERLALMQLTPQSSLNNWIKCSINNSSNLHFAHPVQHTIQNVSGRLGFLENHLDKITLSNGNQFLVWTVNPLNLNEISQ